MKTITPREFSRIEAVTSQQKTPLLPGILEKDLLVTQAIHLLAEMNYPAGVVPVFCGGTCLSKAYGVIKRMSEDVDFKLVPPSDLNRSATRRAGGIAKAEKRLCQGLPKLRRRTGVW
jgi:hypothetical protein